jgi:serine/threonine-protein kinase
VVPASEAFQEETRLLLRRRLLVVHAALGVVGFTLSIMSLIGLPVLPTESGLGEWIVVLPLLMFAQSLAGLLFLVRRPTASIASLRCVEMCLFVGFPAIAGVVRFLSLAAPVAASPDPRYPFLLYRFDAALINYPFIFAIIAYGVLIPNTRRRSLIVASLLCAVPIVTTAAASVVNPELRATLPLLVPVTLLPLFVALVIAVYSASRAITLRRAVFDARREVNQVGAYNLVRKLGAGGMGDVYLAEHRLLKRPCAVKFIRPELAAHPATAARFEREVRAITGLSHFNTVRVYDYGRADDGSFYYVMEYLDGPTLESLVKRVGPLEPARVVYLLRQLCGALAEAHAAGLVHRDVKPSNVIVARLGGQHDVAKLLDFGLVQDLATADSKLTIAGMVLGTPAYMCPEQASGSVVLDARSDIYTLGLVGFFAITGRQAFEKKTVGEYLTAHLTEQPPRVSELRADVPADLAEVIARCLEKKPESRYQSAHELEQALSTCACVGEWSSEVAANWWANTPAAG